MKAATHPHGALLLPSFAVERAQDLISDLGRLMAEGAPPLIPVYVDSPLATKATREAGRIPHRLKTWLWRDEATVLFTGFQAVGTLGRILQDGARSVRIQGEEFTVRARIRTLDLYSGHADGAELGDWIGGRLPIRHEAFLVHGEEAALANRLTGIVGPAKLLRPERDEGFALTPTGSRRFAPTAPPRLKPEQVGRLDWHNDVSRLLLEISEEFRACPDEKSRSVLIRRLQRALRATDAGR